MRLLTIDGGSLGYSRVVFLDSFSLKLEGGCLYELRGENGAGKSTLLRALAGLHPLHSGRRTSSFRRHALVPQASALDPQYPLTVHGFLSMYGSVDLDSVERFGLASCLNRMLRECSGGELQKALIVRALMLRPDFLALDEPSALDSNARSALSEVCRGFIAQGACVVICTHDRYTNPRRETIEIKGGNVRVTSRGGKGKNA